MRMYISTDALDSLSDDERITGNVCPVQSVLDLRIVLPVNGYRRTFRDTIRAYRMRGRYSSTKRSIPSLLGAYAVQLRCSFLKCGTNRIRSAVKPICGRM